MIARGAIDVTRFYSDDLDMAIREDERYYRIFFYVFADFAPVVLQLASLVFGPPLLGDDNSPTFSFQDSNDRSASAHGRPKKKKKRRHSMHKTPPNRSNRQDIHRQMLVAKHQAV